MPRKTQEEVVENPTSPVEEVEAVNVLKEDFELPELEEVTTQEEKDAVVNQKVSRGCIAASERER